MLTSVARPSRRGFLGTLALGASAFTARGAFAEELERTLRVQEGPFYPAKLPLDTDNDLLIINDAISPAVGEITHLSGKILDTKGDPIRNAIVEVWQCDRDGTYLKAHVESGAKFDSQFPRLRPFPDRLDRRILLPNDQASPVYGPAGRSHSLQNLEGP